MKKLSVFLALAAIILPAVALGAEVKIKDAFSLDKNQTLNGNFYYAGQDVSIYGTVNGDIVSAGGTVRVPGTVSGDIMSAGGTLDITGNVAGDVRVVGGNISIGGAVGGDFLAAGGQISILPDAVINGDVLVAGGTVKIEGKINGKIKIASGEVTINNEVKGDADIRADKVTLGPKAVLSNLTYHSYEQAKMDPSSKVNGQVNFDQIERRQKDRNAAGAILGFGVLVKMTMLLVAALFFALVFKKHSHEVVHSAMTAFPLNVGRGFVFLVIVPVLIILLLVTVLGIPLAGLLFFLYVFTLLLGGIYGAILSGALIEKYFFKRELKVTWYTVVFGVILYTILSWIPVIGWIAKLFLFLAAFGSLINLGKHSVWTERA